MASPNPIAGGAAGAGIAGGAPPMADGTGSAGGMLRMAGGTGVAGGTLPMAGAAATPVLSSEQIAELQAEVRALAAERNAVILAHNYQVPEVQDVADYVGDSLGLSRQAAAAPEQTIVFCGVHFMAETASVLCPEKTVLIPDLDAGCSLADTIDAQQLRAWKAEHPDATVVMYVNTSAEVKALTDYCCTSSNAVEVVRHIYATQGAGAEILFGPDMWLGSYVEKQLGKPMHVWDGECHVHAGIRPADIERTRAEHPDADFLIHPECGCTTSVMEYVAAGDVSRDDVLMLSTGGMLSYAQQAERAERERGGHAEQRSAHARGGRREAVVATEVGMLHPLRMAAPDVEFIPANPEASCQFMKMITLPKLRDSLRDLRYEVRVPREIAEPAKVPIDRMVAIG